MTSHEISSCCSSPLSDDELEVIDLSLEEFDSFSMELLASLYYACGYVAYKEQMFTSDCAGDTFPESDFLNCVSRGRLSHPAPALVAFAKSCFFIFDKITSDKKQFQSHCAKRFVKMFICLAEAFPFDFSPRLNSVCQRFANIFYKGFIRTCNESTLVPPFTNSAASQRKIRKLNCE